MSDDTDGKKSWEDWNIVNETQDWEKAWSACPGDLTLEEFKEAISFRMAAKHPPLYRKVWNMAQQGYNVTWYGMAAWQLLEYKKYWWWIISFL